MRAPGKPLTIDVDSTICETYRLATQRAGFGYTKVRGYHPLLAIRAGSGEVLHSRLRGGGRTLFAGPPVSSARPSPGCGRPVPEAR